LPIAFVLLLLAFAPGLIAASRLPFQNLKNQYAWFDEAVAEGKTSVLNDSRGETSFCFVGPQGFPVAMARTRFKDYWIEPTASDLLIDSTGSWTLVIASKSQSIVSFRNNPITSGLHFPEEEVCGDTIQMVFNEGKWTVKRLQELNRSVP
jgi:hypothetical protein